MRVNVRDKSNRIIGWLDNIGSDIRGYHISKGYVGYYNKSSDITFNNQGQVFCYGDGVQCLIRLLEK